jgi:peptidoglycan hydrolase-like protein with peptidoglycan-binding domain
LSEIQRDLASTELWNESLERSLRRRALAPIARKREARKKRTTLVAGAAVATAPMLPTLGAADAASSRGTHDQTKSRRLVDDAQVRILLRRGDTSPAVGELQKALRISVDDIFGPQTEKAVRDLQTRAKLAVTGTVDARTWLTLFPTDAIISVTGQATPGSAGSTAQWAAVTVPTSAHTDAPPGGDAKAHRVVTAASVATGGAVSEVAAGSGGVSATPQPVTGHPRATTTPEPSPLPVAAPPTPPPATPAPTTVSVPDSTGGQAIQIQAPTPGSAQTAAELVAQMIAAADAIDAHHYVYRWGGGHNSAFSGPYDCSGAVSAVLHAAGLVSAPLVSGDFMHWGAPGPGTVTIYANANHVYMSINGRFFGTSYANAGGGAGWFKGGARPGFVVVHVPFEKIHLRPTAARVQAARVRRAHRRQATAVAAVQPRTSSGSVTSTGGTAAPAAQPQATADTTAATPTTATPPAGTPATVEPTPAPTSAAPDAPVAAEPMAAAPAPLVETPATVAPTPAPATTAPATPVAAAPVTPAPVAPAAPSPSTDTATPASDVTVPVTAGGDTGTASPAPAATEAPPTASPPAPADPAPTPEPSTAVAPTGPAATDGSAATSAPATAGSDESTTEGAETAVSPAAA